MFIPKGIIKITYGRNKLYILKTVPVGLLSINPIRPKSIINMKVDVKIFTLDARIYLKTT